MQKQINPPGKLVVIRRPAISKTHAQLAALAILLLALLPFLYENLPVGQDWYQYFRPATLMFLRGESPYSIAEFHNAPWMLLPLIPFAVLPPRLGQMGILLLGFASFSYIAYKAKAPSVSTILYLTSFSVTACLSNGGLDWIAMLSLVTPGPIALILAATKPQVGIGMAVYWLIESYQRGGARQVVRTFLPVSLLIIFSFFFYGFWVLTFTGKWHNPVNISIFPTLIPVGLYLLRIKRRSAAIAASVCFSPYHTYSSLSALLPVLFEHPRWMFFAWMVMWTPVAIKFFLHLPN